MRKNNIVADNENENEKSSDKHLIGICKEEHTEAPLLAWHSDSQIYFFVEIELSS